MKHTRTMVPQQMNKLDKEKEKKTKKPDSNKKAAE